MDILEYIDKKKNDCEETINEYYLKILKNNSMIKELLERRDDVIKRKEEAEFEGCFYGETMVEDLEREGKDINERVQKLIDGNEEYKSLIEEYEKEMNELNQLTYKNPVTETEIVEKLQFCSRIVLQDSQRCKLELEKLIAALTV